MAVALPAAPIRQARWATSIVFICNGVMVSSWATRIPAIQQNLHLAPSVLGLALFGAPISAVLTMPFVSWLAARYGSHILTRVMALAACAALPLPTLAPNALWLFVGVAVFGAMCGSMDVAMNAQAVAVEGRWHHPIMSSFHGTFSIGTVIGALLGAVAAARGINPLWHLCAVSVALVVILVFATMRLFPDGGGMPEHERFFAFPTRPVLALAVLAFCNQIAENAIGDWSGVYLHTTLATTQAIAALGYGAFVAAMMLGRLGGDSFTGRVGARRALLLGSSLAAVGMALGLIVALPVPAIIGFGCVGAGFAVLFPVIISAAGRVPGIARGAGLTAVMTSGYTGMMVGPPLIGGLASVLSLRAALSVIVLFCLVIALLSRAVPPTPR